MHKLAFIISAVEVPFYSAVIRCLPTEFVDVYLGTRYQSKEDIISFNTLSKPLFAHISSLLDEGYSVSPLTADSLSAYKNAVVNRNFYSCMPLFNWKNLRHMTFMALTHAVDAFFNSGNIAARLYIAVSQRQARRREDSKVARDSQAFTQLMHLPCKMRNEYAYSGPYHIGDWAKKRHWPKDRLRGMLEEKIGCTLDARKPVVAFLLDEVSHLGQVVAALERLAPLVNLVVKMLPVPGMAPPIVRGAYVWPSEDGFAPNLLRFAADFILAGYHSGTLASSTMLGLSVIPYYTPLTHEGGRGVSRKKLGSHKIYLPGNFPGDNVCVDILEYLNPPINLMDTSAILDRMENHSWWSDYAARLPAGQKNIFGDYCIDNAASKTATLLVRAITHGTFGADADAVRLRPEYGTLVQCRVAAKEQSS